MVLAVLIDFAAIGNGEHDLVALQRQPRRTVPAHVAALRTPTDAASRLGYSQRSTAIWSIEPLSAALRLHQSSVGIDKFGHGAPGVFERLDFGVDALFPQPTSNGTKQSTAAAASWVSSSACIIL